METITERKCIATSWQECADGAKYISRDKCQCPQCYKLHGETMYEIGLASAFQSVLKCETNWSVSMNGEHWNLDTKVIDSDEPLALISSGYSSEDFSEWEIKITAKNGTVGELWKACEKAYKKAHKEHGDWHRYIEQFTPAGVNTYEVFYGS